MPKADFIREPYRLFFPVGAMLGILGVGHWFLYGYGFTTAYSGLYHSSMQMLVFLNCFFAGFIMTSLPRFCGAPPARLNELALSIGSLTGMALFLSAHFWLVAEVSFLIFLCSLAVFSLQRLTVSRNTVYSIHPPKELFWILVAVCLGMAGSLVSILCHFRLLPTALTSASKNMMEQGYALTMILGMGGYMIPRLMGTHRVIRISRRMDRAGKQLDSARPKGEWRFFSFGSLLLFSFIVELRSLPTAYFLRAVVAAGMFGSSRVIPFLPRHRQLYVVFIWISAWMIPAGYLAAAIWPQYDIAMLHVTFIGGFSLLAFCVATMMVISHAGEARQLKKPLPIFWIVFTTLILALLKRVSLVFYPDKYFRFLGVAAMTWVIAALAWLIFILPRVIKGRRVLDLEPTLTDQQNNGGNHG